MTFKNERRALAKVDMSSKAVCNRLKRVSQLGRLCLSLAKAKPVGSKEKRKS